MERIEMSRIADAKADYATKTKQDKTKQDLEAPLYQSPQSPAAVAEVPCCCPSCFPFDF